MSYTDGRDFSAEYTVTIAGVTLEIEKLGGGTVGQAYEGIWRYRADGVFGQDLITGTPKTHAEAAVILADFLGLEEDEAPAYFATKYDSAAAEVIAVLSDVNEGFGAESDGDVEAPTGYFSLVILDSACDLDFSDHTNYPLGDYAGEVARTYGVTEADVTGAHIVTTDSQGFVSVETFDSAELAREAYACRAARYGVWSDEDTDPDGEVYVCPVQGHGYHEV